MHATSPLLNLFIGFYYIIYTVLQCDLAPLRPHCGDSPRAEIRTRAGWPRGGGTTRPRPPHHTTTLFGQATMARLREKGQ